MVPRTSRLNTVEVDGRTWLRVVTNTGDKVHLVAPVDGMPGHCREQALPAWGAYVTLLESSASPSSQVELAEIRGRFKGYRVADVAKSRWWIETRCGRPWSHMATAADEADLHPGTVGFFGGIRSGDRACSKCGAPAYGDVEPTVWTPEQLQRLEAFMTGEAAPSRRAGPPRSRRSADQGGRRGASSSPAARGRPRTGRRSRDEPPPR